MDSIFFLSLVSFAILSCATPGPNTLKLAFCSANFGLKKTLPFSNGIVVGRILLQLLIMFFIGSLFALIPVSQVILKVLGSFYMIYLAYCIALVNPLESENNRYKPLNFIQAVVYQFLNPKVWANATTAISVYVPNGGHHFCLHATAVIVVFALVSVLSNFIWMLCGIQISRLLNSPNSRRKFNLLISALYASCIVLIWI